MEFMVSCMERTVVICMGYLIVTHGGNFLDERWYFITGMDSGLEMYSCTKAFTMVR
jgi:energy-converting hydrogenase Eha subunit F